MRTEQIHYLIAIEETNSINKASQKLFVSPQALSSSMQSLENEMGFAILNTTYRGTELTNKGAKLLKAGQNFLNEIDKLQNEDMVKPLKDISLFCAPAVIDNEMSHLYIKYQYMFPHKKLSLKTISYNDITTKLYEDDINCIFCYNIYINGEPLIDYEDDVEFVKIKDSETIYAVANSNLKISNQTKIAMNTLLKYDFVILESPEEKTLSLSRVVKHLFPDKQYTVIEHKKIYAEIVKNQNVITFCAKSRANDLWRNNEVKIIPISKVDIKSTFGYVKRKNKPLNEMLSETIAEIKELIELDNI